MGRVDYKRKITFSIVVVPLSEPVAAQSVPSSPPPPYPPMSHLHGLQTMSTVAAMMKSGSGAKNDSVSFNDSALSDSYATALQDYRANPTDPHNLELLRLCMLGRLRVWAARAAFEKHYQILPFLKDGSGLCIDFCAFIYFQDHFYSFKIIFQCVDNTIFANVYTLRKKFLESNNEVTVSANIECNDHMVFVYNQYRTTGMNAFLENSANRLYTAGFAIMLLIQSAELQQELSPGNVWHVICK